MKLAEAEPPRPPRSPSALIVPVLALLTLLVGGALVHTVLAPTPDAQEAPDRTPRLPGYQLLPLPGAPAAASRRLAHGRLRRFLVRSEHGGSAFTLTVVPLHSRSHTTFALAALTTGNDAPPGLSLQDRHLHPGSPTLAMGTLPGAPGAAPGARVKALQTCLALQPSRSAPLPLGAGGVTNDELRTLLYPLTQGGPGLAGLRKDLAQLLGLEPNVRWECLLISLAAEPTQGDRTSETDLLRVWHRARDPLALWALTFSTTRHPPSPMP